MLATVDYLIANHEALHFMLSILILDRPLRSNLKNFHSHLLLQQRCTVPHVLVLLSYAATYHWVPGWNSCGNNILQSIIHGWSAACVLVNTWGSR